MICTIVCGAPCSEFTAELAEGYVIAADKGMDYCLAAGVIPELAVGDFDSAESSVPDGIKCVCVSPIKDDTDAMLAADIAVERGFRELRFLCALGGRLDHSIANIQMIYKLKLKGISAVLHGDGVSVFFAVDESVRLPKNGGYLSIFAYGEAAEVSAVGVKYPLNHGILKNDFPLGVSNEITDEYAEITVHSGAALIILNDRNS